MRRYSVIFVLLLFVSTPLAKDTPGWMAKPRLSLTNGNQLYANCQELQQHVVFLPNRLMEYKSATVDEAFSSGACWGYVLAVVDSIPAGEGFDPNPRVLGNQYADVVSFYLRDHPASRHLPAYVLVRTALTEAFPKRPSSK